MKHLIILIALLFSFSQEATSQVVSSPDATTGGNGGFISIKKLYQASISPVASGVTFPYQISFSISGSVSNLVITDVLPSNLEFVSETSYSWLTGNHVAGTVTWTSSGPVAPGAYSIVLNVRFKRGVTCDGDTADNSVSVRADNISEVATKDISIMASAANGWKISKRPKNNIYSYLTGSTVSYDVLIYNSLGQNGSLNLQNVSVTDLFPTGAVLAGNTCTSLTTLDVTASGSGNPYSSPYSCTVDVTYPAALFPDSTCPVNKVVLTAADTCDQAYTLSDSIVVCMYDSIPIPPPNAVGFLKKRVFIVNPVAGCLGRYTLFIQNTGNTTITDFQLNDVFPSGVNVTSIEILSTTLSPEAFSYTTNLNSGSISGQANYLLPNPSPNFYTSIQIDPVSLAPQKWIGVTILFDVSSSITAGQIVTNTATLTSLSNSINLTSSADFVVANTTPKLKVRKDICSPASGSVYRPGDELVYRVGFQNYGSGPFVGGVLTDILDPRLEYVSTTPISVYATQTNGNPYPPCNLGNGVPAGTSDLTSSVTSNFNIGSNTLTVNLPTIPSDCQSFFYVNGGYSFISQIPTYWVEFKVKVKDGTVPGIIPNQATISNAVVTEASNVRNITINALLELTAIKEVSIDGGATYGTTGTVTAGSTVKYKLTLTNSGNINLTNINLVDVLPNIGDLNLQSCFPRNTSINTTLQGPLNTSSNVQSYYSNILNPDVTSELGTTCTATPAGWVSTYSNTAKSIKGVTIPSFILTPGATEVITFDVEIPITATSNDTICNNYAVRAEDIQGTTTTPFLTNMVCIAIEEFVPQECCQTELEIFKEKQSIKNLPQGDPATGGVPASVGIANFVFNSSSGIPITEFNARVIDFNFSSKLEECPSCNNNPALWGSIENLSAGNIGALQYDDVRGVLPPIRTNQRELQWKNSSGYVIQAGDNFELNFLFPAFTSLRCCRNNAFVCVEFSWKDANCMVCREVVCFDFRLRNPGGAVMQSVRMNPNSLGLPRLSSEEIESIEQPETGMLLWDVDENKMKVYDGEVWKAVIPE